MSNSSLVVHTNLTPNCNKPRNHAIDTVSIHCVVGQLTAESIGGIFKPKSAGASSNYGVDKDGRVGLYVNECDHSWCSSNPANDNRAVTIEVASDTTHPYAVTPKALAALIELCADICRRNGIKRLLWKGDKSLVGQVDKQNMTVHRWFAPKACPGDYLYERHGYIADEVNKRLGAVMPPAVPAAPCDEDIWKQLAGAGFNPCGTAGLMGNLFAESGLIPTNLQNSFQSRLKMDDTAYTAAVDAGAYANFVRDGAGYGLAQWTYWSRKQSLLDFAKASGASIGDLTMQLKFLLKELQGYPGVLSVLKTAATVQAASDAVLLQFERPADTSAATRSKRAGYGQGYYNKFAGKTAPAPAQPAVFAPYAVRVTGSPLNIRKGPGTNYPVSGSINDNGVYTIVEEANGPGASKWGKLKSGAGWIALGYTKKI